jgi:hypothetical protein
VSRASYATGDKTSGLHRLLDGMYMRDAQAFGRGIPHVSKAGFAEGVTANRAHVRPTKTPAASAPKKAASLGGQ